MSSSAARRDATPARDKENAEAHLLRGLIMREAGSIDFANGYASKLVVDAKTALVAELPKSKARDMLAAMADFFIKRNT